MEYCALLRKSPKLISSIKNPSPIIKSIHKYHIFWVFVGDLCKYIHTPSVNPPINAHIINQCEMSQNERMTNNTQIFIINTKGIGRIEK